MRFAKKHNPSTRNKEFLCVLSGCSVLAFEPAPHARTFDLFTGSRNWIRTPDVTSVLIPSASARHDLGSISHTTPHSHRPMFAATEKRVSARIDAGKIPRGLPAA